MKYLLAFSMLFVLTANAQSIHYKSVLVDTHNDAVTACIEKKVSLEQVRTQYGNANQQQGGGAPA